TSSSRRKKAEKECVHGRRKDPEQGWWRRSSRPLWNSSSAPTWSSGSIDESIPHTIPLKVLSFCRLFALTFWQRLGSVGEFGLGCSIASRFCYYCVLPIYFVDSDIFSTWRRKLLGI
ncbi:unnamed protein product, partial [Musa acuminata subsp. burmannicoides]